MTTERHPDRSESQTVPSPFLIDVFSLFPRMFEGPLDESILRRARDRGLIQVRVHDIRNWTEDRHRTVDDAPYGGGAGMVMGAPPIVSAVEATLGNRLGAVPVLIMSAGGRRLTQETATELARGQGFALICGHYEGIDERVGEILGAEPLSIGDYVLTGGELPAMVVIDAVSRLRPGVIDAASVAEESHSRSLVEYPHYTRPVEYRGLRVPEVLLQGHHTRIAGWRRARAQMRTARWRPDLLVRRTPLSRQPPSGDDEAGEATDP